MKSITLTPKNCKGKRWRVPVDWMCLKQQALIPLHAGELSKAAASMPLALVRQGVSWLLVAVCGQQAQNNLFIHHGKWQGSYQPVWLSSYPFNIVLIGETGMVTFDEESGLLSNADQGEPFFNEAGQLTAAVSQRIEVLKASIGLQAATQKAIVALDQAGVIAPWPEAVKAAAGIQIDGLYRVDERAMAQLPDEVFLRLRKAQALPIAYALNFSIQQAHLLHRLARMQGSLPTALPVSSTGELDLEFLNKGGTISFGG